jgi:hypothetical protein
VFVLFILICGFVNLMLGSASAQWAVTAPIFVPMLMLLGYSPEVIQAAYRIGDSTTNIITPMMSYFGLILAFAALATCARGHRHADRDDAAVLVTLTPGTLTVDMRGGEFLLHCLDEASAEHILDGSLERQVAGIFEPESAMRRSSGGSPSSCCSTPSPVPVARVRRTDCGGPHPRHQRGRHQGADRAGTARAGVRAQPAARRRAGLRPAELRHHASRRRASSRPAVSRETGSHDRWPRCTRSRSCCR